MVPVKFSAQELMAVVGLSNALLPVQELLSLAHLRSLLFIAAEPGLSVNELADRIGAPQPTASRYVAVLLGRYQNVDNARPVQFIIQEVSADDPRRRALFLTADGRRLIADILGSYVKSTSNGEHG
ncbi:MarR family winged helix-turn-helix transcriptional regulator [Phyllobacterium sp. P30BS-XVII]|uniref:MarR family winged helix-turn-helix transcriptional regulator n=1 Tax=Phyllobacterium sp. P30BS-XVII TaxID=2587046 RepID=UPI0015FBB3B0|nr:MarR family winged helix-turn-helix transcriptional regulator [Phyllobacterium sp. P30BS-XVII]MBA8903176.1 DNA-binding MarR family transcriptional regulator [Phyllobacterium sp. P30BS-XVII]